MNKNFELERIFSLYLTVFELGYHFSPVLELGLGLELTPSARLLRPLDSRLELYHHHLSQMSTLPTAELRILSFCYHVNQFLKASHLLFLSLSEYKYMLFLWRTQTNTDFCTQNDSSGTEFEG